MAVPEAGAVDAGGCLQAVDVLSEQALIRARSRGHGNDLKGRAAFGARDRGLAQVIKLRATARAKTLCAKLGFRHRAQSSKVVVGKGHSPMLPSAAVSIEAVPI